MSRIKLPAYTIGMVFLTLSLLAMSLMIFTNRTSYCGKYYHDMRKKLAPDSMRIQKVLGTDLTWDTLITYLIKANVGLFTLSSIFILGY